MRRKTSKTTPVTATGEIILYRTEDGDTRIECRFLDGTIWLTQAMIAELFQTTIPNVNLHLKNIYKEGEITSEATIKDYLIVRSEGGRKVARKVMHYNLPAILAVGYRIASPRGTQFRQWAAARLEEYLRKGFVLDDERLKNPPGPGVPDYFDELLERIREIRASERRFYKKITDIYALSVDYDRDAPITREFFATVQNKLHWAITGKTAAEIIQTSADALLPHMGLTTWKHAPDASRTLSGTFRPSALPSQPAWARRDPLFCFSIVKLVFARSKVSRDTGGCLCY
jgi:hypothetical protein